MQVSVDGELALYQLMIEALRAAAETGRCSVEGWRVGKDGTQFWASVTLTPIRGHGGTLLGFVRVTRNHDDRREQEIEMRAVEQMLDAITDYEVIRPDAEGGGPVVEPRRGEAETLQGRRDRRAPRLDVLRRGRARSGLPDKREALQLALTMAGAAPALTGGRDRDVLVGSHA